MQHLTTSTSAWPQSGDWSIAPAGVAWCHEGNGVSLGDDVHLGNGVRLGNAVTWAAHLGYDPRGYAIAIGLAQGGELRIYAGCRDFCIEDARAHWGDAYDGASTRGRHFLAAIDFGLALAAIHSPEVA